MQSRGAAVILTNEQPNPEQGIKRDRWGRPMVPSPFPDGPLTPHLRPSSIAMKIADRWALERWMQRMTARGMALRPDLVALASTYDPDDAEGKKALDKVVDQAKEAAGSARGANIGTAIHAYIEQINRGQSPSVLPDHQPAIDAYKRCIDAHGIEPVLLEEFVVWPEMRTAGSCDIYANYQGRMVVMDVKTGQHNPAKFSLVEFGAQFACYGNATHRWDGTTATPLPEVDTTKAYVLWVPSGGETCELIEVDIVKGRRFVEIALEVDAAHKDKTIGRVIDPPTGVPAVKATPTRNPVTEGMAKAAAEIKKLLDAGVTAEDIRDGWPEGCPPLKEGVAAHTEDTISRILGHLELLKMAADIATADERSIENVVAKLRALPGDLFLWVEAQSKALDPPVPHLRSGDATYHDLRRLGDLIAQADTVHAERVMQLTTALSPLTADEQAQVVAWACEQRGELFAETIPLTSLDDLEAERALALAEFYEAAAAGIDDQLADLADVVSVGQAVATKHGITVPQSPADVAADRVLAALVIHSRKQDQ